MEPLGTGPREEDGHYYVDKTPYMRRLVEEGKHYFLSRPRRFGKSLFLDTLKELFEGNEPLFEGLDIHGRWDWSVRYPVLRLDFSRSNFRTPEYLHQNVMAQLDAVATEALLFQTGYLTITGVEDLGGSPLFRLGYPNREVRQSLNESLLDAMLPDSVRHVEQGLRLRRLLAANDFEGLETLFRAFFSGIPHDWHRKNDIARYEGCYASVFYSHFAASGLDVAVEDSTSHGRLDMAVRLHGNVYLFEFKVIELVPEGAAMHQLKSRHYADKYRASGQPIWLIGVEFSRETRNVATFEVERA